MKLRVEVVALDCLMVRLFDEIAEANMPWMLAASESLRAAFGEQLIDLVPSYTTLMVHYDLTRLSPGQARELIAEALIDLSPNARTLGKCHVLPVWYDLSVGPELSLLSQRSGLAVKEVIRCHSAREYQVFALGFAPGSRFVDGAVLELVAFGAAPPSRVEVDGQVATAMPPADAEVSGPPAFAHDGAAVGGTLLVRIPTDAHQVRVWR